MLTNNEKMISLYGRGPTFGLCEDCSHLGNKDKCSVGRVKVNKHMVSCGKFESKGDHDD